MLRHRVSLWLFSESNRVYVVVIEVPDDNNRLNTAAGGWNLLANGRKQVWTCLWGEDPP